MKSSLGIFGSSSQKSRQQEGVRSCFCKQDQHTEQLAWGHLQVRQRVFLSPASWYWVISCGISSSSRVSLLSRLQASISGDPSSAQPIVGLRSGRASCCSLSCVCKAGARSCVWIRCFPSLCGWQVALQGANLSRQGFYPHPLQCVQKGTEMEIVGGNTFCSFTCINHKRRCHGS